MIVMSLIFEDKTGLLRRGLFDVQNSVGLGRDEEAYHQAFKLWLQENDVPFLSKAPHVLQVDGKTAHKLFPDFVVWDLITIELKAVPRHLNSTEFVQLFNYLKCRGDTLGLMVNMGLDRVHMERIVYETRSTDLQEDWSYWTDHIEAGARDAGRRTRKALQNVYKEHTTGYGDEVLERLILFSLQNEGLNFIQAPVTTSVYNGSKLGESSLDCLLVENEIVVCFTALFDSNNWNLNRGRSYMNALNKYWGIAANFGKTQAQITGLRRDLQK